MLLHSAEACCSDGVATQSVLYYWPVMKSLRRGMGADSTTMGALFVLPWGGAGPLGPIEQGFVTDECNL